MAAIIILWICNQACSPIEDWMQFYSASLFKSLSEYGMTTVLEARSFHTRLRLTPEQDAALRDACRVFGDVTRAVYCELKRGNDDPRTDLTAKLNVQRWYINSAMRRVKGLLQGAKSNRSRYIAEYEAKADACEKKAERESGRLGAARTTKKRHERRMAIHWAKRRAERFRVKSQRLAATEPTICFGSRALFRQQPAIQDAIAQRRHNAPQRIYTSHAEWLEAWREARADELFSTGEADASGGNKLFKLELETGKDGVFNLSVMLPRPCHGTHGKRLCSRVCGLGMARM